MVKVYINDVPVSKVPGTYRAGKEQATVILPTAEAFSHKDTEFISIGLRGMPNPLIGAVHTAFAEHFPLELSPDVI